MGISFSHLLQTGAKALERNRARQIEDEERASTQEMETLRRALMSAQIGKLNAPAAPEPYTLGPGQGRYSGDGKLIAQQPNRPDTDAGGFTLSPGQARYGPDGKPIAQRAESPAKPRAVPTPILRAIATNRNQLMVIDRAMQGIGQRPSSVGIKGVIPDVILQRTDPEGVGVRADIADIGSMEIRDRSGAAVTAAEFPRLAPFIPNASDTPETVRIKLQRMREIIEEETRFLEAGASDATNELPEEFTDVERPSVSPRFTAPTPTTRSAPRRFLP